MGTKALTPAKQGKASTPSFTPAATGLLQRACACGGHSGVDGACTECKGKRLTGEQRPLVQAKLTVSRPGDRYEQEADRIADQVMGMSAPQVQRQAMSEEEEEDETLQMKPLSAQITPLVQRETIPEEEDEDEEIGLQRQTLTEEEEEDEEDLLQTKRAGAQVPIVTPSVKDSVQSVRQGGGKPLAPATRAFMEPRFGHDFGQVRVHTDSRAAAAARAVNSRAFTVGKDVVLGAGQYAPETRAGQQLLAHELTHVVQQTQHSLLAREESSYVQRVSKATKTESKSDQGVIVPWNTTLEGSDGLTESIKNYLQQKFELSEVDANYVAGKGLIGKSAVLEEEQYKEIEKEQLASIAKQEGSFFLDQVSVGNMADALAEKGVVADRDQALARLTARGAGTSGKVGESAAFPQVEKEGEGVPGDVRGVSSEPNTDLEDASDQRQKGGDVDSSDAKTLGVLITTPGADVSENLTIAGEIENFKEMSRGEIKDHAVKRASDTLSYCFGLAPSAAEVLTNSRKIQIHIPSLRKLHRITADDSPSALPIIANMGSLEMSLVDELGLSAGNSCEKKTEECFFGERLCLPVLNFTVSSIEASRNIDTAFKFAEAASDAIGIFMTLGIFEAAEEGGELLFKQWLRQQRKKGREAKKVRDAGKQLFQEQKQLRKQVVKEPGSVRPSKVEGFDAEIRVGEHTYRRKADGTWCRSSADTKCGIKFDPQFEKEIDAALKALPEGRFGPYSDIKDGTVISPNKNFTNHRPGRQRDKIFEANKRNNGGRLKSDDPNDPCQFLVPSKQSKSPGMGGTDHDPCEAVVDHIIPKDEGGTNAYSNARVLSRDWNNKIRPMPRGKGKGRNRRRR